MEVQSTDIEDWIVITMTYDRQTEQTTEPSKTLTKISAYIEDISQELREISLDIHDHPELKFKERHAHHVLTTYLQKRAGWNVTPSAYDLETAFVATFDGGAKGPVVSFNAEYDALPGIGHACGHNLIAVVSLAAAVATAQVMRDGDLPGRVVLFGTPAEADTAAEGGGGKIKLLERGAYKDVDISLISHPASPGADAALVRTAAYAQFNVEYFGKPAHAAARPWDGVNALDALILAIQSVSLMRQQTEPGDVIQYKISNGGSKPNIIHAYAAGVFVLRAPTLIRLHRLKARFQACIEGAATATGATLQVKEGLGYLDHIPNRVLGSSYTQYFGMLGGHIKPPEIDELTSSTQASTDQGNISHAMPSLSPNFWIRSENGNHTPAFEKAAKTEEAHQLSLRVAKALAATAVDVLSVPGVLQDAKEEFQKMKERQAL